MAVISVCSTKGGVGKTTLVICLADAFARQGGSVVILDADPNRHVAAWRRAVDGDCPVHVIDRVTEETILDRIAETAPEYSLVLIDVEGAASQTVSYAIMQSDLVLIPTKVSGMDLQEVFRTYEVVRRAERVTKRAIHARAVFSQMPTLNSRVQQHARSQLQGEGIPVLSTEVIARAAYASIHFTGNTPAHPDGDAKARAEVASVLEEVLLVLTPEEAK